MKRLAINQPYLFPYLGFYQMVALCDEFIFFDDVSFIKKGYIHRNSILYQNSRHRFTLPVLSASQNKKINELYFSEDFSDLLKTIRLAYKASPYFSEVYPIIADVLSQGNRNVASITSASISKVFDYLGISPKYLYASEIDYDREATASGKILSLCLKQQATHYVNAVGGQELYDTNTFKTCNITLEFIQKLPVNYNQGTSLFEDNLSIIDVLMWNSKESIHQLLKQHKLLNPGQ